MTCETFYSLLKKVFLLLLAQGTAAQSATILLPDGSPAAGAKAASLAVEYFVHVKDADFARPNDPLLVADDGALEVTTKTAGRWIILHPDGWADADLSPDIPELRLTPWQEIRGTIETEPQPDAVVSYHRLERPFRQGERGSVFWTSTAPVGSDGAFTMTHVPTGHGNAGLLREAKSERRVLKWRDYPQAVEVPQNKPLHLGGGVTVGGRIVTGKLPAVLSLSPRSAAPCYNILTEDDGRFAIPGVMPGEYWLTARPDLGEATHNIPQRKVEVGTAPIDLGDLTDSDHDVEIDSRVEMFEGLVDRICTAAVAELASPIEKIWIGELVHPTGQYGARVTFLPRADSADPTHAKQTVLLLDLPGEAIRKYYPPNDTLGWGYRFTDAPVGKTKTFERTLRVFPLPDRKLYLPLDEGVDYDDALALLRAVASDSIQRIKPKSKKLPDGSWQTSFHVLGDIKPDDLANVTAVQKGKDQDEIKLQTRTRPFGGRNYQFKKTAEGFLLTGVSSWVS